MFRSAYGGSYTVTGVPVVSTTSPAQITGSIAVLLIAALLVMAATLLLVFRSRLRLLPLAIALAAAGITFGLLSLVGATLTMASIAVLPILIGLAVDYAIQFQARAQEARRRARPAPVDAEEAVARAAGRAAPTIATAALATATGLPRAAALAGADGAGLRPAARGRDRDRARLRADAPAPAALGAGASATAAVVGRVAARRGGDRRFGDRPARRTRGAAGAARDRAAAPGARAGRTSAALGMGRSPRGRSAQPGPRAGASLPCWRVGRLGRRHADRGPVGRHQARALEHAGAAQPAHARAGHRRLGRDRRHRARAPNVATPPTVELDDQLRERAAHPLRLPRDAGLRARDAVPGAVAARPVLDRQPVDAAESASDADADQRAARGGADLLLAGGDHARPPRGDARVRDPADAAVAAAARDRLHALAAAPAAGRRGPARRAAGAGRPGRTPRCRPPAAAC